ncbi:MAG TPA: thermonuclease family protein [Candidatus Brocadiia bacterium]|nr:thermonuclease family protein [Candidatus Brocadiia bacterium]
MPRRNTRFQRATRRVLTLAALALLSWLAAKFGGPLVLRAPIQPDKPYRIVRVVDGDTLALEGGATIRLIGIDTPEKWDSDKLDRDAARSEMTRDAIKALGRRASDFASAQCRDKVAFVEFDPANNNRGHRDKHGRCLAYVFLAPGAPPHEPRVMLNRLMVQEGYARVSAFPFGLAPEFRGLQAAARKAKKGLWRDGPLP